MIQKTTSTPTIIADERKLKVQELLKQGLSQAEIARQLGIDRSAVHYIIKRAGEQGLDPSQAIKPRPDTKAIGLICQILKERHWTQQQLADYLGKNVVTVNYWLSGNKKPGKQTIIRLEELLSGNS